MERAAGARALSGDPPAPARRGFRLLRYFSIASLIAILLATLGLALFFRQTALKQLIQVGEDNNVAVARVLAGTLRPSYAPLLAASNASGGGEARAAALHEAVLEAVRETQVVKLRIYDSNGRAIYSSDAQPAAEESSANPGVASALAGTVSTSLDQPDYFDAFGLILPHRSVLTSHVPVRRSAAGGVEAVLAVSSDVTPYYEQVRRTQTSLRFGAGVVVLLLYGALFLAVRRADRIIRSQEDQRQRDADTIRHLAHHDELTGLPNRKLFADRLSCAVSRARRSGQMAALMFIDLDRFKEVNDTLGHAAGDKVLRAAGQLLRDSLRTSDTVARMGGDEFTIILEDVADLDRVETVAEKIKSAFAAPVMTEDGVDVFVTPSIGITLYPRDGESAEALLNAADAAMYDAKAAGRNAWRFYQRAPTPAATARAPERTRA